MLGFRLNVTFDVMTLRTTLPDLIARSLWAASIRTNCSAASVQYNGVPALPFTVNAQDATKAFHKHHDWLSLGADLSGVELQLKAMLLPFFCFDVTVTTTAAGRLGWEHWETYTDSAGMKPAAQCMSADCCCCVRDSITPRRL